MFCVNCGKEIETSSVKNCVNCKFPIQDIRDETKNVEENNNNLNKMNIIEEELTNNESSKELVEIDTIDKWSGIKKESSLNSLSLSRFKFACKTSYAISIFNIIFAFYLIEVNQNFGSIGAKTVLYGGIIYLVFTFIFHKLKSTILLGVLLGFILLDKIFTMIELKKFSVLGVIISVILLISMIQALRAKKDLIIKKRRKVLEYVFGSILFILILLSIAGLYDENILEFDKEWTPKSTKEIKDSIYNSYFNSLNNNVKLKGLSQKYIENLSESTASCSINNLKNKYPLMSDFEKTFEMNEKEIKKIIAEIKKNCFQKAITSVKRQEL